jgi:hypothetical protein
VSELSGGVDPYADEYSNWREVDVVILRAEVVLVDVVSQHLIEARRSILYPMLELVAALYAGHTPRWLVS